MFAITTLLLVLAACGIAPTQPLAARPQRQPIADTSFPPIVKAGTTPHQRIIDIAQQEWIFWGRQTVSVDASGRGCVSDSALPPPPEYFAAQAATSAVDVDKATLVTEVSPCWRYADGSGMEATRLGCLLTLRYWHILGREPDCGEITTARWAWSAAFISWVMRQAGLSNEQFLVGEAHNLYVTDARDGLLPAGAFGVEAWPAVPNAGDMICSARDSLTALTRVDQVVVGRTHMHCDIVITVDLQTRTLKAIGGNVQQSVSLSTIDWGMASALPVRGVASQVANTAEVDDEVGNAGPPWLLVMRNHLQ